MVGFVGVVGGFVGVIVGYVGVVIGFIWIVVVLVGVSKFFFEVEENGCVCIIIFVLFLFINWRVIFKVEGFELF